MPIAWKRLTNAFSPHHSSNPAPKIHYETTGPEIWEDNRWRFWGFSSLALEQAGKRSRELDNTIKQQNPLSRLCCLNRPIAPY